jgi:hypothetical protein
MANTTETASTTGPLGWRWQRAPAVRRWARSLLTCTSVLLVALGPMVGGTRPLSARGQQRPAPTPLLATSCATRIPFIISERLKPGRVAEQATIDLQGKTTVTPSVILSGVRRVRPTVTLPWWLVSALRPAGHQWTGRRGLRGAWHRPDWSVPTDRSVPPG